MKRTVILAAILAVLASVPFYLWVSTDARAQTRALARTQTLIQLRLALLAQQQHKEGVALLETQAALAKLPSPEALGVTVESNASDIALVSIVSTVATEPPIALVMRDDVRMVHADEDGWLLRSGLVSQRAVERRAVALLIAAFDKPDLCPAQIRVQGSQSLGAQIDARFAGSIARLGAPTGPIEPLCRRERQRRLAEAELDGKEKQLGFTSGLFIRPTERLAAGFGGKVALLLQGMETADDLWEPRAMGEAVAVLMGQLIYEDAVVAASFRTRAVTPSPALQAVANRLAPKDADAVAFEACALNSALLVSLDKRRFVAELIAQYLGEHWPSEPRRSGALALLYALSEADVPKEGAAKPQHLQLLLDVEPRPLCLPITPTVPITRAISKEVLNHLTSALDRTGYIL